MPDWRTTFYAPGAGGNMEGPFATSRKNPITGRYDTPFTLDDVRLGRSPWVTVASDPSRYGQSINLGSVTYRSPIDNQTYTLPNVQGYVHDTGSAFQGRPDKLDIAQGDFRGWKPQAAEQFVAGGNSASPEGSSGMASLLDMMQPQQPQGLTDRLGGMSNSLIGLGMGLLQPYDPWRGTNAYSNALRGYQTGAALDQEQQQNAWKRSYAEQQLALERAKVAASLGGEWTVVDAGNDLFPERKLLNKRTGQFMDLPGQPRGQDAASAAAPPPFGGATVPYTGAGPLGTGTEPPTPAAPAATGAQAPGFNENYLRGLGPNAATLVKGVANYEIDPATLDAKVRAQVITAAKNYRPDYSSAEYQKRASPPPAEVQARIGLGKEFLDRLGDAADQAGNTLAGLKTRVARGELNDLPNRALAQIGQGGPGEIRRAIDSGADALMRGLTGAGMSIPEAQNYARRYQFSPLDTRATSVQKLNELESALRHVMTKQGEGRGGEDFLKGFRSTYGQATTEAPTAAATRTGGAAVAQPVRVNNPAEARQLPKGTPIILPDGRTGTVP